jgi:hypothetical protein
MKMETELTSEISCFLKQFDDGQSPKKEDCQFTSVLLCSLLFKHGLVKQASFLGNKVEEILIPYSGKYGNYTTY